MGATQSYYIGNRKVFWSEFKKSARDLGVEIPASVRPQLRPRHVAYRLAEKFDLSAAATEMFSTLGGLRSNTLKPKGPTYEIQYIAM
jgi:hypothetical protein